MVRNIIDSKLVQAAEEVLQQLRQHDEHPEDKPGQAAANPTDGGTLAWLLRQFGLARHTARLESADLDLENLLRVRPRAFILHTPL